MRTLIISDIHERTQDVQHWLKMSQEVDHTIFLGDFFDTHFADKDPTGMISLLWDLYKREDVTLIWGNHDTHYAFTHPWFKASGYQPLTQQLIWAADLMPVWLKFKVATSVDNYLISHAGFRPETIKHLEDEAQALKLAFRGEFHPLWTPGWDVGGNDRWSGATWQRWKNLLPVEGWKGQIVGHTYDKKVRERNRSYCLDTGLKNALLIEDGTVTVLNHPEKEKEPR